MENQIFKIRSGGARTHACARQRSTLLKRLNFKGLYLACLMEFINDFWLILHDLCWNLAWLQILYKKLIPKDSVRHDSCVFWRSLSQKANIEKFKKLHFCHQESTVFHQVYRTRAIISPCLKISMARKFRK